MVLKATWDLIVQQDPNIYVLQEDYDSFIILSLSTIEQEIQLDWQ